MAKKGKVEEDPGMSAKAVELKREFQKLVEAIVDDDEFCVETIDRAQEILFALKELKLKKSVSIKIPDCVANCPETVPVAVPEVFRCPLSKAVMADPVIISTGQTYERSFIQSWLDSGKKTCPRSKQVLTHTILTPNHLIREMAKKWCNENGIKFPDYVQYSDAALMAAERDLFLSLLEKMSSTLDNQKEAAKELRSLTKRMPSFRALFGESANTIPQLLSPLISEKDVHPDLEEDLITTLLNLSIPDNNKKLVAETPMVIPLLIKALNSGAIQTRSNAAAALFTLSAVDSSKALIGKSGAFKPLIDLLDEGHPSAMKDAASAIFNLCILHENRSRAVADGAIGVINTKIANRIQVDELLPILAMLCVGSKAIEEMCELGTVQCLLGLIKETTCDRNKENCILVLHNICYADRSTRIELQNEENTYGTISQLAQNGTSRAKRKAEGILERLNRLVNITHTA